MSKTNYTSLIWNWIETSSFEDLQLLDRLKAERETPGSLFQKIREASAFANRGDSPTNHCQAYRILLDAVSEYLLSRPFSYSGKKILSEKMRALCDHIGKQYQIPGYEEDLEELVVPVVDDLAVEIIKELHAREGVTKIYLRDKYKVTERTIQDYIHRISGDDLKNPVRIGGQAVLVPVNQSDSGRNSPARYKTEDTMSPIVLQLNITQAYFLLKSLQLSYDADNNIPFDLGMDIWSQLSDYTRKRIQIKFETNDPDFKNFLEQIESEKDDYSRIFKTEGEMFDNDDLTLSDQLLLAYKDGGRYNLTLINPRRTLRNQCIEYDPQLCTYYSYSEDEPDSRVNFTENDLREISKA